MTRPLTYRLTTLGCRVNHAETREMECALAGRGLARAKPGDRADLEVIHTCSVTGTAAAKSRQAVRRARRRRGEANPDGVIVTGCWASTNPDEATSLAGSPAHVVGHGGHDGTETTTMIERFAERVDRFVERAGLRAGAGVGVSVSVSASVSASVPASASVSASVSASATAPASASVSASVPASRPACASVLPLPSPAADSPSLRASHVRAELRIQDGCDAHCTFCIIPRIRRTLRSKRVRDAVEEATRLVGLGHREIVLSGIFIGAYGHETALRRRQSNRHASPLADLVDAVAQVPGLARLRISSMEPGDVSPPLLDAMTANAPVVVPHLHLPLQSGSDRILRRMNRQYRVGDYLDMIDRVTEDLRTDDGLPPAITTDIICGFPGETERAFEETRLVAERVGYLHMHVFPYSARAGTAAARWRDQFVPDAERKRRVRTLLDLEADPHDGLSLRYRRQLLGRRVRVILEQRDRRDTRFMTGRCDHYALVHVPTDAPRGRIVDVDITDVTAHRTVGRVAATRIPLPVLIAS